MFLLWAVGIIGIIALVKWLSGEAGANGTSTSKSARQIIDQRYARGEIDREEFEQQKKDLEL